MEPADVGPTHGCAPGRLDLTGFLICCDAVVDDNVGIGHTADRAVQVMDRRTRIGDAAAEIVRPLFFHHRKVHRFGVDELQTLSRVLGVHSEARKHQV